MRLAYSIAHAFVQAAVTFGWKPPQSSLVPPDEVSYQYLRSVTGSQPKASKLPPVVSEFKRIITLRLPAAEVPPVPPGQCLTTPWRELPSGACLLAKPPARLIKGDVVGSTQYSDISASEPAKAPNLTSWHFGIFRTPQQFVEDAVATGHPISNAIVLPKVLQNAIQHCRESSPHMLAKERVSCLSFWLDRARELQSDENMLHESLPHSLGCILKPKRLLVWKSMLEHFNYPDLGVFDEVVSGTTLTGVSPYVDCFEHSFKPALVTEEELRAGAPASRESILWSTRSSGDSGIDEEVYTKTAAEVESGWLSGPVDIKSLPTDAIINRRFGIKQSSGETVKIRLIDDFSASGVNSSVQVSSMPKLHTLDVVAALSLELTRPPVDGPWVGKTVDLSSAYRQLGISPKSEFASYISVFNPKTKRPEVYLMRALPFGASRSVYSFLRVSHSLWWLGCVALNLTWSSFFDDYITFCRECEAAVVDGVVSQFFKLLGWLVSAGDKDMPFASEFKALGVEISLTECHLGFVVFRNTAKRIKELVDTITSLLDRDAMSHQEALSLRGRMQFAKAQIWGRSARLCLASITDHAFSARAGTLSPATRASMEIFRECLVSSPPRRISCNWDRPWFIFTDASFQPSDVDVPCGLGGVLVDPIGNQRAAFSFPLDFKLHLEPLGFPKKKTVIFEAELLALLLGMTVWSGLIAQQPCMFYVDNNAARDISISGHARTEPGSTLASMLLRLEDSLGIIAWYARVASASNIADAPSRCSRDGIHVPYVESHVVSKAIASIISQLPTG
eukprot:Skav228033  [mRNA]  locus=scaffold1188:5424:7796:+ [translate_table: standard]